MLQKCWWYQRRDELLALMEAGSQPAPSSLEQLSLPAPPSSPVYVYSLERVHELVTKCLQSLKHVDRLWFAVKANNNAEVLATILSSGITGGFECVSLQEVCHIKSLFPSLPNDRLLFTPNFASRYEYEQAFKLCKFVTLDNEWPLYQWPDTFRNREIFLRLDYPSEESHQGDNHGHLNNQQHQYVKTTGSTSKFGISLMTTPNCIDEELLRKLETKLGELQCKVVGLHIHRGSQLFDEQFWAKNVSFLYQIIKQCASIFSQVRYVNVGGGLGVDYHFLQSAPNELDLNQVDSHLKQHKTDNNDALQQTIEIWMESGRYLVADAGVLLASVTQLKMKDGRCFVGTTAGMNSLIRPALYSAHHEIVNLTQLKTSTNTMLADVVGQICESSDFLARQCELPASTNEGDILLIATAGAYGHVMASSYNMRDLPQQVCLKK